MSTFFYSSALFLKDNPFGQQDKRKRFSAYFFSSPPATSSTPTFQYGDRL